MLVIDHPGRLGSRMYDRSLSIENNLAAPARFFNAFVCIWAVALALSSFPILKSGGVASARNPVQVKNQEAMKEKPYFSPLRVAQSQAEDLRPIRLQQSFQNLARAGRQVRFLQVGLQPQFFEPFDFKRENRLRQGGLFGQLTQERAE
jgi:hypothetical protein